MQSANTSNPLVGAWKLISFQFVSEGTDERFDAYDEHPQGFAIFTEARALFLLTAGDRLTTDPASELFERMCAYSGRYRMHGDRIITSLGSAQSRPVISSMMATRYRSRQISLIFQSSPDSAFAALRFGGVKVNPPP